MSPEIIKALREFPPEQLTIGTTIRVRMQAKWILGSADDACFCRKCDGQRFRAAFPTELVTITPEVLGVLKAAA